MNEFKGIKRLNNKGTNKGDSTNLIKVKNKGRFIDRYIIIIFQEFD